MQSLEKEKAVIGQNLGLTSPEFLKAEKEYYYQKAKVDYVTGTVDTVKNRIKEAEEQVEKARL